MKNKEIEELLNELSKCPLDDEYALKYKSIDLDLSNVKLLLSYIEELQEEIERQSKLQVIQDDEIAEANESITWWQNRFNAVERDKKQLENNRDKALKIIDSYDLGKYDYSIPAGGIIELREVLKNEANERNIN